MNKLLNYNEFLNEKNMFKREVNAKDMFVPSDILELSRIFSDNNKKLYIVGGAPRDFLLKKKAKDFDLVTDALPEESKEMLKNWENGTVSTDEQGQNFGVLRIYTKLEPLGHELATFRKDISKGRDTKGDDQKVIIGDDVTIYDDVMRRDLTINALFYDIKTQKIVDYVGGIDDIKNRVIQTVGEPYERFSEDRLRILRVFRFAARSGGKISENVKNSLNMDNRLNGISPEEDVSFERIFDSVNGEWNKMIEHAKKSDDISMFVYYLDLLKEFNMFDRMFPGIKIEVPSTLPSLDNSVILSILMHKEKDNDKLSKLLSKLKLDNRLIDVILYLFEFENNFINNLNESWIHNIYELCKKKKRYGISDDTMRMFSNFVNINNSIVDGFLKYCNDGFLQSSKSLMDQGFKGVQLGQEIKRLEYERFKNEYL